MEYHTVIISTEPGKEGRVLGDVLDLLFPYDAEIEGEVRGGGRLVIKTRMDAWRVAALLKMYPVRGLVNVRLLVGLYRDYREVKCRAAADLCRLGVAVGKLKVRVKRGWRQKYYGEIKNIFSKISDRKNGLEILIEEFDGKIALEVILFRPHYASFNVQAKI